MADDSPLACIHYEPDTDRVAAANGVAPEMRDAVSDFADRYRACVGSACSPVTLGVAFDPSLLPNTGQAARRVLLARDAPRLARRLLGAKPPADAVLVVVGPAAVAYDGDDGRLREAACSDVGNAVGLLYPARGSGPIAPLMPWLLGIACETIAFGGGDPAGAPERSDRTMARALTGISASLYDSWNAHGQMLTDHPAWPYLAEATAAESRLAASGVVTPTSPRRIAEISHAALAKALRGLGVDVMPASRP